MKTVKQLMALVFLTVSMAVDAQLDTSSELYQTLAKNDSILFHAAFNSCETEVLNELFTEDFEFYHDRGGLMEGRAAFIAQIAKGCANRNLNMPPPAKRILIPESLEVYPMYKNGRLYAAIQHGVHRFESLNGNNTYQKGDIAKFTHVWVLENERWKIRRELSYDHQLQN